MNKVKELFLKNVQWLTLLAGLAFLGWMAFVYFFQSPTDPHVDTKTAEGPIPMLQAEINGVTKPTLTVPTYAGQVTTALGGPATRPTPGRWTTAIPLDPEVALGGDPTNTVKPPTNNNGGATVAPGHGQVTATPTLPAATVIGTSFGQSSVIPGMFGAAASGQAPPAGIAAIDKTWTTAAFTISIPEIAAEFTKVGVPAGLPTEFTRVEAERVEVLPDGSLGAPVRVQPLTGSQLSLHPMPAAFDDAYVTWAGQNQVEVLQSPFYQVAGGSTWVLPGQKRAPTGIFDPKQYLTGKIPDWLTPEQRKLVEDLRAEEEKKRKDAEKEKIKNRPPAKPPAGGGRGPGGGGGGGGATGGGGFAPPPPPGLGGFFFPSPPPGLSDGNFLQVRPGTGHGGGVPPGLDGPPHPGITSPGGMPPGGDIEGQNTASAALAVGKVPTGPFDPSTWKDGPVTAFVHDETVEPEKTYRYRMRYVMLNPICNQPSAATKADLAQVFRWESAWSEWTTPASIPPAVSFFVTAKIGKGAASAQFEVFHFTKGSLRAATFTTAPGDLIGSGGDDSDFATGYTLVDIRSDARGAYALVMSPQGVLSRHDVSDSQTPLYRDFKGQASAAAAPPTGG